MSWIPEKYKDLTSDDTRAFASLATLMKDGSPQVTPVWFDTTDQYIQINSAKGRVKDINMRRDPRVAITIIDPNDPYRHFQIRGKVIEITTEGAREHINKLSKKYRGTDIYAGGPPEEIRVTYKILPQHVTQ